MDFSSYQLYFQETINAEQPVAPYNDDAYLHYAKLNWTRQQRWLKVGELNLGLAAFIEGINTKQDWIVITEPWCGDAAHIVPFIDKISQLNPLITLDMQLRDAAPFLIDNYLTGSSKSIPKLIIRDEDGKDLLVWGPRPKGCQDVYDRMKAEGADFEETKLQIQSWYNIDKGKSFQQELLEALR
ncbi:MAG: thioredoxin family protein [Pedobacter sp.]|nr:MAG: thioredoxin family protein [Pedobacter sp.]